MPEQPTTRNTVTGKAGPVVQAGSTGPVTVTTVVVRWAALGIVVAGAVAAGIIVAGDVLSRPAPPPDFTLDVRVQDQVELNHMLFPSGSLTSLPPLVNCEGAYRHGEPARRGAMGVVFTVSAGERPVRVHGVRLLVERGEPEVGDVARCPPVGGAITTSHLAVDLDDESTAFYYPSTETGREYEPRPLALEIMPGRSERVEAHAVSERCACRWRLELDVESSGEHTTVVVDDRGRPFELAPRLGPYSEFTPEATGWSPG